jgi:excisionase family DNA binding protein
MTAATTDKPTAVLWTDLQAAEYLGVEVIWLQRESRAGRIAHTRVGRAYRYNVDDLDGYLAARRREANTPTTVPARGIAAVSPATAARARNRRRI